MKRIALLTLTVLALVAGSDETYAQPAQDVCTFDDVISAYQSGLASAGAKKYAAARSIWRPLADAGFAPAQRRLAEMAMSGKGARKSSLDAAFWSGLAARSGDRGARQLFGEARLGMELEAIKKLNARLDRWQAKAIACSGRMLKTARAGANTKFSYVLTYHKRIADKDKPGIRQRMDGLVKTALSEEPDARLLLTLIDEIEVYPVPNNRYHRYTGWKQDVDDVILRLPVTSFNDKQPVFVARQILMTVKRRIYDQLEESELEDRQRRQMAGIDVFGSPYPDIRNRPFFDIMRKALDMGQRLPPELRRYLDILDAVYYNPASKHMVQEGTIDAAAGYYNRGISGEGNRVIFIRRDVLFSSPLFMLRLLVHEGTHAAQDQMAWRSYRSAQRDQQALNRLRQNGQGGTPEASKLQRGINQKIAYAKRWYEGKETETGRIQDIAFECEALINEIGVVRVLAGEPNMLRDSGYLKVCPDAQQELVKWQDERLQDRRGRQ